MAAPGVSVLGLPSIRNYLIFPWLILLVVMGLLIWPYHVIPNPLGKHILALCLLFCALGNLWICLVLQGYLRRRRRLHKHGEKVQADILEVQHEFAAVKRALSRSVLASLAPYFAPAGRSRFPLRLLAIVARNPSTYLINVRRKNDEGWEAFRTRAILTLEDSTVVVSGTRVAVYYQFRLPDGRSHGGLTAPIPKHRLAETLRYGHLDILYDPKKPERNIPVNPHLRLRF